MKYVTLLRHAKSDWGEPSLRDFDRPLNPRGRAAAPAMGAYLCKKKVRPDLILCSAAIRTRQTLNLLAPKLGIHPETIITEQIYLASPADKLMMIKASADNFDHILMIGHNPGTHQLACDFVDIEHSVDAGADKMARKFPTAAVAHFKFPVGSWSEVGLGRGHLVFFMTPKMLGSKAN